MAQQVERIEAPSRADFETHYAERNKPVIITGVVDKWPAFTKWTPEYLEATGGDSVVPVHFSEDANFRDYYVDAGKRQDKHMEFAKFVEILQNSPDAQQFYMTEFPVRLISPDLLADLDFTDYFDAEVTPYEPCMFLGRNTCMPMHYHGKMEAFLCQIVSDKRITLFAPNQYSHLYCRKWYQAHPLFSNLDGRKIHAGEIDLEQFPKFKKAKPVEVELEAGEMLFIPVQWWHVTSVPDYQVNVSHFFNSKLSRWTFPSPGIQNIAREILDRMRGWNNNPQLKGKHFARKLQKPAESR